MSIDKITPEDYNKLPENFSETLRAGDICDKDWDKQIDAKASNRDRKSVV